VNDPARVPPFELRYPLFVKPAHEGSSIGINGKAIVNNKLELEAQVQWVWNLVHSTILVEEFIKGREVTISILANEVLPIVEIVSPTGFYSLEQKESLEQAVTRICPAVLSKELDAKLQVAVLQAMHALDLYDLCRFDIRINETGKFFFLEVNPLPLIFPDPKESSFILSAQAAGYDYPTIIQKILQSAMNRWKLT
jgi:D-alanine-D-alanine ligase